MIVHDRTRLIINPFLLFGDVLPLLIGTNLCVCPFLVATGFKRPFFRLKLRKYIMRDFRNHYWAIIALGIFTLDHITKTLVLAYLPLHTPINILPSLNLFFSLNAGSAFGFLHEAGGWQKWIFAGIAALVSLFIIIWQLKLNIKHNQLLVIALSLVLGGTLGNLYDRIFYHEVIDFIDFYIKTWHYATFNIADIAICIGAGLLIIDTFKKDIN